MDENDPEGLAYATAGVCDSRQAGSNGWRDRLNKGELFSEEAVPNPQFHDIQKIFVPSCSGDGWMGSAHAMPDSNFGPLFFHGKLIVEDVIDHLTRVGVDCVPGNSNDPDSVQSEKIDAGSEVLFSGESRGANRQYCPDKTRSGKDVSDTLNARNGSP